MGVTLDQIIPRLYCILLSKATKKFSFIPKIMRVVERHYIDRQHQFYKQFDDLSFLSRNLSAHGKYYMSKQIFPSGSKVGDTRSIRLLSAILKPTDDSKSLPAKISKQILKQLVQNWEGCPKSRIAYDRYLPPFSFLRSIPQYKHKIWGFNFLIQDNQSIEKRGGDKNKELLHLSQSDIISSTKSQNVLKVRIGIETALYFVEAAHQKLVTLVDLNSHLIAGRDLWLDHLVPLASNKPTFIPTIYDKKHLKSIHQGFNQRRAFLLSKLDHGKDTTRQIQPLTFNNRNKRLENYLHQTSSLIVKRLVDEKIIQLIIGPNLRGKQNIKLDQKKDQIFVVITHTHILKIITYQAELVGIKVIVTEAYYTKKCRFLDLEPVGKQESYQGKRGKRGWFRPLNESRINADVNAALNMIIKVKVNSPLEERHNPRDVFAVSPVRVEPVRKKNTKSSGMSSIARFLVNC
ncbi:transposase [Microcoleus sp. D2_18a_D3]|uniref:transposase n=1 Tax=Microcoleus sp. D2_18a_D3 TaxID=3055330 RepID=UPI002FD58F94